MILVCFVCNIIGRKINIGYYPALLITIAAGTRIVVDVYEKTYVRRAD